MELRSSPGGAAGRPRGRRHALTGAAGLLALGCAACTASSRGPDLVFVDGRAVAAAGDTLLAFTRSALPGLLIKHRRSGALDTIGQAALTHPHHVQEHGGSWYVSDMDDGRPLLVELGADGTLRRRIALDAMTAAPHQFAVLPDGRIVLESPRGGLVALDDGHVSTFATLPQYTRTGLLLAARGGVLYALPGEAVTLYNAQGNIRWRLPWPWRESAFISDMAEDAQGRIHLLGGEEGTDTFVVFSLSPANGEVVRWSDPVPAAIFSVDRLGNIRPG